MVAAALVVFVVPAAMMARKSLMVLAVDLNRGPMKLAMMFDSAAVMLFLMPLRGIRVRIRFFPAQLGISFSISVVRYLVSSPALFGLPSSIISAW